MKSKGPVLMGRDWLHKIHLDWHFIKSLQVSQDATSSQHQLSVLLDKYSNVLGTVLGNVLVVS